MTIVRRALWAGFAVGVTLAGAAAAGLRAALSASIIDREEDLWPDPRERQGFRLESLRNAVQSYASDHDGALPSDLVTLIRWIPIEQRASVAGWVLDLWRTPVLYEPIGQASFTLRSAGADRAWRTIDDVVLAGPGTARR